MIAMLPYLALHKQFALLDPGRDARSIFGRNWLQQLHRCTVPSHSHLGERSMAATVTYGRGQPGMKPEQESWRG